MGDDWTTVHYRRGRLDRRPRQPYHGGGTGTARGTDRAPPVSYGRQTSFPPPNLPVPPTGRNRYFAPQVRSYAAVVMGRHAPTSHSFAFGTRNDIGKRARQQPADPVFGQLIRKLHAIIKMVHHLRNVAPKPGKAEPRMISRMVDILASMIKPASPTAGTADLIWGNAKNWGYNTLLVLEKHYQDGLETLLKEVEGALTPDWRSAFEVAARWARKNLPRITQDVIEYAEALIMARVDLERQENICGEVQTPSEEPLTNRHTTHSTRDAHQQTTSTQLIQDTQVAQHHTRDAQLQTSPPVISPVQSLGEQPCTASVASMTGQDSPGPSVVSGGFSFRDSGLVTPSETHRQTHDWEISSGSEFWETRGEDQTPTLVPQQFQDNQSASGQTMDSSQSEISSSTPKSQRVRVIRHANSNRKMIEWDLNVEKKWLIVGDSNLGRIPGYSIQDLQIDSYPGANFRHAQALLSKAKSQVMVEKLVLSFGINSRGQRAKETAIKQMQAAVRTAKNKFPYAEIWIPVINFSSSLPAAERVSLQTLNAHIMRNMPFIPALANSVFRTEKDEVHWTKNTACAMLDHWLTFLNWNPPQASVRRGTVSQNP